jgi:hypothetical protein
LVLFLGSKCNMLPRITLMSSLNLPETFYFIPRASKLKGFPLNFYIVSRVANLWVPISISTKIEPKFQTIIGSKSSSWYSILWKHSGAWCLGLHRYSIVDPLPCW